MDNRFKQRFSRLFRSSLSSCRGRNFSDVVRKAVFSPRDQTDLSSRMLEDPLLSSQKAPTFPSICTPRCPESISAVDHGCIMITSRPLPQMSALNSPFVFPAEFGGRTCPPASLLLPIFESKNFDFYEKTKKKKKKKEKNKMNKKKHMTKKRVHNAAAFFSLSSQDSVTYRGSWWFSSDEDDEREDETDTLFSSMSLSSDSRGSRRRRSSRRRRVYRKMEVLPMEKGATKMEDSFAVVKSSSDPYNDFRTSMVEMIVEKQIFSTKGLEQLLQCFLSLNSNRHHRIILEVFTEIYKTLFSNGS